MNNPNRTRPISTTAAVKRILRAAGVPLTTQKGWGTESAVLVTSRMGFPCAMIDTRHTDAAVIAAAADALAAAGLDVNREYMDSGFVTVRGEVV